MGKIIGLAMLWVLLAMLGGVCEMAQFSVGSGATGTSANVTSHIQQLMTGWDFSEASDPIGWVSTFIGATGNFVTTFWDMLWFNYPFFQNEWGIIRWILFLPLGIGFLWVLWNSARGNSA